MVIWNMFGMTTKCDYCCLMGGYGVICIVGICEHIKCCTSSAARMDIPPKNKNPYSVIIVCRTCGCFLIQNNAHSKDGRLRWYAKGTRKRSTSEYRVWFRIKCTNELRSTKS